MPIQYRLMSRQAVKEKWPNLTAGNVKDDELGEWLEWEPIGFDEDYEALIEIKEDQEPRLLAVDRPVDPEDARLFRHFEWVIKELNKLGERVP